MLLDCTGARVSVQCREALLMLSDNRASIYTGESSGRVQTWACLVVGMASRPPSGHGLVVPPRTLGLIISYIADEGDVENDDADLSVVCVLIRGG